MLLRPWPLTALPPARSLNITSAPFFSLGGGVRRAGKRGEYSTIVVG
jgi:hypothetical protein